MENNIQSYSSRWIVMMPAECESSDLDFMNSTIKVVLKLSDKPIILLIENIIKTESAIESAFYASWERINLFTMACSYIGYGSCTVLSHVATLPTNYREKHEFEVLSQRVIYNEIETSLISQNDLDLMQNVLNDQLSDAAICLSMALRTDSLEEKITLMHSALQEIAKNSDVPTVKQTCQSCNAISDTGRPATNNYIKSIFNNNIENGREVYQQFTTLRNKIGHGKPISNLKQHLDAKFVISCAQGAIVHHFDNAINFIRDIGAHAVVGLPFSIYKFMPEDNHESYQVTAKRFNGKFSISHVQGREQVNYSSHKIQYGISTDYDKIFDPESMHLIFGV